MSQLKVFVVGNSIYSSGIDGILADSGAVQMIGTAATLMAALTMLKTLDPDVIIVAGTFEDETIHTVGAFITLHSHIPILRTDLGTDKIQLITSQYLGANSFDLLVTLATIGGSKIKMHAPKSMSKSVRLVKDGGDEWN